MSLFKLSSRSQTLPLRLLPGKLFSMFMDIKAMQRLIPFLVGPILGLSVAYAVGAGEWIIVLAVIFGIPFSILILRYPIATIPLWLVSAPFFAKTATSAGRHLYWVTQRAIIPIGLGILILSYLAKRRKGNNLHFGLAELMMGVYVLFIPISILISQNEVGASLVWYYDRILISFGMYLLVRLANMGEAEMKKLIPVAFILALSQSAVGLFSWYLPGVVPSQWMSWQGTRSSGTLGDPAVYSSALIFAIAFVYHVAMNRKSDAVRTVSIITFGLGLACVFLTLTRGSWLGAAFVLLGLIAIYPKQTIRVLSVFAVIGLVLGGTLLADQISGAARRLTIVNTVNSRIEVSQSLLKMFAAKPIFGWGYETESKYSRQFLDDVTLVDTPTLSSHNTYLTILAETGVVGFALYIFPFVYWLFLSIKALPHMPKTGFFSRGLLVVMWLAVFHHFVVANFMDMRFFPFGLTLWWLILGLIANLVVKFKGESALEGSSPMLSNPKTNPNRESSQSRI